MTFSLNELLVRGLGSTSCLSRVMLEPSSNVYRSQPLVQSSHRGRLVGVLSSNQTLRLQALVRVIVGLFTLLPGLAAQLIQELVEQVRSEKPDYRGFPSEIANNLTRQSLVELEPAAFIALLHAQLAPPRIAAEHLTGIPPPSVIQPRQIA